jgi:hypothetical protein
MTSEGLVVVRETEQLTTYPHPAFALPSRAGWDAAAAAGPIPPPRRAETTKRNATANATVL